MDSSGHALSPSAVVDTVLAELAPDLSRAGKAARSRNLPGVGTVYRRGNVWWIKYSFRGKRVRESSKSPREGDAIRLLRKRIEECGKGRRRDPVSENRVRMADLFDALAADYRDNGRRSTATLAFRLAPLRETFGQDRALDVTGARITRYAQERIAAGKARATVNRELAALRRAFVLAVEREQLSMAPPVKLMAENNARQGFVTAPQFDAIVAALPEYLKDVARFAWFTGWRRGEIASLQWSDVDLDGKRVTLRRERSKNGQPRTIPFVGALGEIIARRVNERTAAGDGALFLFHRNGQRLGDFRKSWDTACEAGGRPGTLFHDLRRSAVRNLVSAGVDQVVAMKITGHRTVSVFQRYRIVADDDVRAALERTQARTTLGQDG